MSVIETFENRIEQADNMTELKRVYPDIAKAKDQLGEAYRPLMAKYSARWNALK